MILSEKIEKDVVKPYQAISLPHINLGGILLAEQLIPNASIVLKSLNRHGLIAGATGSGKTKTMQVLCEQLSLLGIPSLVMDIKGDISGLGMPGTLDENILHRSQSLQIDFEPQAFPVELLTLDNRDTGLPLRTTLMETGALLYARILDLNETQASVITALFEFAKMTQKRLISLEDFKNLLQYIETSKGKNEIESRFGNIAAASVGTIFRKVIELQAQGGQHFFAEPAFNVLDLMRSNDQGLGIISILRLMHIQDQPKIFSSFMLKLLDDLYRRLPEAGDLDKPRLIVFIDEAHLIFKQGSKALIERLDTIVKLIRSKGVGLIFCTQSPTDIPESILSQLGLKIQHALRAFTAKDRKSIKLIAQNFPESAYYNIEQLLTNLSIGQALVCALDEKGQPTPLVECQIRPPQSRMGPLTEEESQNLVQQSTLYALYNKPIPKTMRSSEELISEERPKSKHVTEEPSVFTQLSKNTLVRQITRQLFKQITDQLFKLLGLKKL